MSTKLLVSLVVAILVAVGGIFAYIGRNDGTRDYKGPLGERPMARAEQFRHPDGTGDPRLPPTWKTNNVLRVTNPSERSMTIVVDCDPDTRATIEVKKRTTQDVLLTERDKSCDVFEQPPSLDVPF